MRLRAVVFIALFAAAASFSGATRAQTPSSEQMRTQKDTLKFLPPVRGQLISCFGCGAHGSKNEGVNWATWFGAPVRAIADGTVAYAGNELKGYGNLILIRHQDGYVSAYAYLDLVAVSRGETVKRGQTVGTVGKSGGAESPQLHFQIRRGSTPVDPTPLLE